MWTPQTKLRYSAAHQQYQAAEYPSATRDFGTLKTQYPDVRTGNGLNKMIVKFLDWSGHYGNRINTTGRQIYSSKKRTQVWIKGTTKTGTGDNLACINGRMCFFEGKVGSDTPRAEQVREQERVRKAGGVYEFVRTPEEFFILYDKVCALPVLDNRLY